MDTQDILQLVLADQPSLLARVQAASRDQQSPGWQYAIAKLAWHAWTGSMEIWFIHRALYEHLRADVDDSAWRVNWDDAVSSFRTAIAVSNPEFIPETNRWFESAC